MIPTLSRNGESFAALMIPRRKFKSDYQTEKKSQKTFRVKKGDSKEQAIGRAEFFAASRACALDATELS